MPIDVSALRPNLGRSAQASAAPKAVARSAGELATAIGGYQAIHERALAA